MSFLADLLQPRLVQSHSTVIIPLYKCILFIRLLDCSEFSGRLPKVSQALNAHHRDSVPSREQMAGLAVASWLGLNQQVLQHAREAVAESCAVWASVYGYDPYYISPEASESPVHPL